VVAHARRDRYEDVLVWEKTQIGLADVKFDFKRDQGVSQTSRLTGKPARNGYGVKKEKAEQLALK